MARLSSPGPILGWRLPGWPVRGGVMALLLAAALVGSLPDAGLARLADASGLARADMPRLALAIAAGLLAGAATWSALYLLVGPGGPFHRSPVAADGPWPSTRTRADAHPDAPPRAPLTAAELGVPPPPERDLPADLDQPLAAFDPAAIPDVPRQAVRPVAPIAAPPFSPARLPRPDAPPPSIAALLDRLERGKRRR